MTHRHGFYLTSRVAAAMLGIFRWPGTPVWHCAKLAMDVAMST